jgi:hypothetical protein
LTLTRTLWSWQYHKGVLTAVSVDTPTAISAGTVTTIFVFVQDEAVAATVPKLTVPQMSAATATDRQLGADVSVTGREWAKVRDRHGRADHRGCRDDG